MGTAEPKFKKPKILLIDLDKETFDALQSTGYNVYRGKFGDVYCVSKSDKLVPLPRHSSRLPNLEEQEIVFINLTRPEQSEQFPANQIALGVQDIWQNCKFGSIDPRPYVMNMMQDKFDKISKHGGIFIVFASDRYTINYSFGHAYAGGFQREQVVECSNWDFLCDMSLLNVNDAVGHEINFENFSLANVIKRGSKDSHYVCTLSPHHSVKDQWLAIAKNKYGEDVAGVLALDNPERIYIILPQMPSFKLIVSEFVEDILTGLAPKLFPEDERKSWVHLPEYEIPEIRPLRGKIDKTKDEAERKIEEIQSEIQKIRTANAYWHTLLTGTGVELVEAVIIALKELGFQNVVDLDKSNKEKGITDLREDIQIHDPPSPIVVDVKGVQGHPEDHESEQAQKHALMRIREWNNTKVKALAIINHQRSLPPHSRDRLAYRQEIIKNAEETHLGLMTTLDLHCLVRNKRNLKWIPEIIRPIFYRSGRIEPIPENYKLIGDILHKWENAFGVIPDQEISIGDRLAIECDFDFIEFTVQSLMVDSVNCKTAATGSNCGIGFKDADSKLRKACRLFKIR